MEAIHDAVDEANLLEKVKADAKENWKAKSCTFKIMVKDQKAQKNPEVQGIIHRRK